MFAHPDDETGAATTLAHYALVEGKRLVNVYATRGEGGGNMVGRQWGPSLGLLRESELRACLGELGVERVYFLNQRDWAYTESAQMTLEFWDREGALENLVRIIRSCQPEVLLTMNPTPNPGQHGHHQAAGILAVEAFRLAADSNAFPDQIRDEGLDVWQTRKLYIGGTPSPYGATIESTAVLPDGRNIAQIAGHALSHHRSQGFGGMANASWLARPRTFQLLKSTVGFRTNETDLFVGLDREPKGSGEMGLSLESRNPEPRAWFEGSPAVERFRSWCEREGVQTLAQSLDASVSVIEGGTNMVRLRWSPSQRIAASELNIVIPEGWKGTWRDGDVERDGAELLVTPAVGDFGVGVVRAGRHFPPVGVGELKVNVVPSAVSSFTEKDPTVSPIITSQWNMASRIEIPSGNTWQGSADGDGDVSAVARVMHGRDFLYVLVDVTDDKVVRNIAPDDVRGHWRSDSVEICIDPVGRAEHTLQSFKVGIFPFLTDGSVGAARDADANQGPISRTASGMKLVSEETAHGYRIAAAIPWNALSRKVEPGATIGFNVLIYDGDKENAAIGENINECRLAWSPGRGVQGRPEDWGALTILPSSSGNSRFAD